MKKEVWCRNVKIGGEAGVSVQSMLNVPTEDVEACIKQIRELEEAGCDIVRLAIPTEEAAAAFAEIRKMTDMPLVADIHFNYRLALMAIEAGADKIRINPGNIGSRDRVKAVADACREKGIPIRVGVNSGSLEKDVLEKYGSPCAEALAESALNNAKLVKDLGYDNMVLSLKASDVITTIKAYEIVDRACDYPLHIGVTEAGTAESGIIKSSVGLGTLLTEGIGNTMRVSLTGNPVNEVRVAKKILASCGYIKEPVNIVSCPTCGRTKVDLDRILQDVENAMAPIAKARQEAGKPPITVAVMGCEVNGPGEAREADFGLAGGKGKGILFRKGEIVKTVSEDMLAEELIRMIENEDI